MFTDFINEKTDWPVKSGHKVHSVKIIFFEIVIIIRVHFTRENTISVFLLQILHLILC